MEEKIYAIKAYESTYGGFHGVCDCFIEKCLPSEVEEIAAEASYNVMSSYSSIMDGFCQEAKDMGLDKDSEEFDSFVWQCTEENIMYEIYEVVGRDNDSLESLDEEFCRSPNLFIERYCEVRN